jgi:type II secretion system protein I
MPGSPTGHNSGGFTLVEVLLAITILAAGALLVIPALQRSADHLQYLYQRRDAEVVLGNLVEQTELRFKSDTHLRELPLEGEVVDNGTSFRYQLELIPVNVGESLMELRATVRWMGEETAGLSRSAYVAN